MNHDAAWQCLSVREFIGKCNWDGAIAVLSQPSDRLNFLTAWQCLTTRDFFTLNNWSGTAVYAEDSVVNKTPVFSLTLPTNQLWQCFNWSGISSNSSEISEEIEQEVIEQAEEAIAAVEEFTLNDLSQLF